MAGFNSSEMVLAGDLNYDWLSPTSESLKSICDSLDLTQLIDRPTRPNITFPARSSLLDLVLTKVPHKYSNIGVFANDLSDHSTIAVVRDAKLSKNKHCMQERF